MRVLPVGATQADGPGGYLAKLPDDSNGSNVDAMGRCVIAAMGSARIRTGDFPRVRRARRLA